MRAPKHVLVLIVTVGLASVGCSSGADRATNPDVSPSAPSPVTLTLGTGDPQGRPDTVVVDHFAEQVDRLSDGAMQIEIVWAAGGEDFEQGVVALVRAGDLDLGWIAARAWDTVGVSSFQALQAPFLITDQGLLGQVLTSSIADDMLAGLGEVGLVGLGLYPDELRHPLGYAAPLRSVEDFTGAAIRLVPSNATDALVRALGGEPVYGLSGADLEAAIQNGEIDGTEVSVGLALDLAPEGSYLTGNVILFPRVNTLFAAEGVSASLSDAQRAILEDAARAIIDFVAASIPETEKVEAFCSGGGEVAAASKADVAALVRSAQPVYDMMEADPPTAAFIDQIRELKDAATPAEAPTSCDGT